jgi:hypothetical protein
MTVAHVSRLGPLMPGGIGTSPNANGAIYGPTDMSPCSSA